MSCDTLQSTQVNPILLRRGSGAETYLPADHKKCILTYLMALVSSLIQPIKTNAYKRFDDFVDLRK